MQFVLNDLEELLGGVCFGVVVYRERINVPHFLIEAFLRGTDVSDALQQLIELILLALARLILQPLIVHREALHEVLAEPLCRPAPELHAPG